MTNKNHHKGSLWRKWDLQVHAPGDHLNDGYKTDDGSDALDKFCDEIEESDVQVLGITDYFAFESVEKFLRRFKEKYSASKKVFFFNLELRLNETVNKQLEEVNTHLLFNPTSLSQVEKFLTRLRINKTGADEKQIYCSELKTRDDFASATVTRESINRAFEDTFGKKATRQDHFLVITAANNDGLRPERGAKRKEGICDEIDKFSDAFLGGLQNINYYLNVDRYEDDLEAGKKPVLSTSDSHSFDDIEEALGKRVTRKDAKFKEIVMKDVTWIKADPSYEGLKQVLYEPNSGERVFIGPVEPDQKDEYKVIRKIKFPFSGDFPTEIEFNNNLCSIIGSRSSGKSALLAYIAHSIIPEEVEKQIVGPGEGEEFRWDRINVDYSIEWANGESNNSSPGRVLYIPQNYLFEKSKDANAIKEKIKPVLFGVLPEFGRLYNRTETSIEQLNSQISSYVKDWFTASAEIAVLDEKARMLGDRKAVAGQKRETIAKIKTLRETNKLSEPEVKLYQEVSENLAVLNQRNIEIENERTTVLDVSKEQTYFSSVKINLVPSSADLPPNLREKIANKLNDFSVEILNEINKYVLDFKNELSKEEKKNAKEIARITVTNSALFEKYAKNLELETLVKSSTVYTDTLKKIDELEEKKRVKQGELRSSESAIENALGERIKLIENLSANISQADQSSLTGINFKMEYGVTQNDIEKLEAKINVKEITDFIEKNRIKIDVVRLNVSKFLNDLYNGTQKIISRNDKQDVAKHALRLTETVLFVGEMEGDRIGGFSEPTMTPGKRALFALRLILAESEDTWPLLIDQPEDDLDSRSIYDEIVPFLKEKKKERQIIMVSHNANLVIGADSEQLVIANRHGSDRPNQDGKQFNYLTGSLEFTQAYDEKCKDTLKAQGTCEHACAILDGGKMAFESRKNKYNIR